MPESISPIEICIQNIAIICSFLFRSIRNRTTKTLYNLRIGRNKNENTSRRICRSEQKKKIEFASDFSDTYTRHTSRQHAMTKRAERRRRKKWPEKWYTFGAGISKRAVQMLHFIKHDMKRMDNVSHTPHNICQTFKFERIHFYCVEKHPWVGICISN